MSKNATELTTESSRAAAAAAAATFLMSGGRQAGIQWEPKMEQRSPWQLLIPRNTTARNGAEAAAHKTVKLVCAQSTVHASSMYTTFY